MRYLFLVFLVIGLPGTVFWAVNGMASPADTWERFSGQLGDIRRSQPEPVEEEETGEPVPEEEPEQQPDVVEQPKTDTPEKKPVVPIRDANAYFVEGRFKEAADAYGQTRSRRRALAQLGEAFANAFPTPTEDYLVVELRGSSTTYEGYKVGDAIGGDAELMLRDATGRAMGLPTAMVSSRRRITADKIIQRTRPMIEKDAASGDARRLFRATAAAFRIGRPDLAAPLLERIVEADKTVILRAITKDATRSAQAPLFRAYSDAVLVPEPDPEPVVTTRNGSTTTSRPKKTNGGSSRLRLDGTRRKPRRGKLTIKDQQANAWVVEARPYGAKGKALYNQIAVTKLKEVKLEDVESAISNYEKALELYEKAWGREEENDAIYALVTGSSKKLFQLRFWREQVGGR